ncbi:MAG: DUF3365 domain-containing protein [Candidatus Scalindua sp.]|nr:DUF3365 domain-containing protein [Candidatus Scalindua sp.]MBT6229507.1 DUF3365 domain-containing protein [Candidatus Scalindua sp.]
MKLQTKLLLIMMFTFLLTFSILEYFSYRIIKNGIIDDMRSEAKHIRGLLMATRRVYHHQFLTSGIPLSDKTLGFLPAHSMSLISKDFSNWTEDELYFNNVSDRPRNQRNVADSTEKEAISYFRKNPTEKERFIPFKSAEGETFYHFSAPIWVEEYCLKCHGKKEAAPETIRESYDTSFDYKAGELRGVMSIKLPATQLEKLVQANFLQNLWIHLASFTSIFILITFLLHRYVNVPLSRITKGLSSVAEGRSNHQIEGLSGEMAIVGNTFNKMSERLVERERLLKESEEKLRAIIDNTTAVIYLKDINGKYILINHQYEMLFNISKKEVIGKTDNDIFPKDIAGVLSKNDKKVFVTNSSFTIEETVPHGEELNTYISLKFPLLNKDNNIYAVCGISTNITDQKKMEKALAQSEKLKSIGTITAGISHEFNNILAIISGNIQLLKETYKDNEKLTKVLCTIKTAVDDGAQISSKMLKFTKTENNAGEFVSSDIRDLIIQSIDFTSPRWKNEAQANGIDYQIDKDVMKSISCIMCNPSELREVFINIIINALDAMPEGGKLSFSTWSDDDTVFVGISDTGEGMPEDVKKNIFDPFFTTKTPVGTGLGMSMAYGIITRHGGQIEVESEVGKGSKFTLQFPITNKSTSSIATPEPRLETNEKKLYILVADDEEALDDILDDFLSGCGHKVKTVDNGVDAINMIKGEDFDLVLCDLAMPNASGHDVVKVANGLERRPKIGIITGWDEKLKSIEEGELEVDFVLKKPFDFSMLIKDINDACR